MKQEIKEEDLEQQPSLSKIEYISLNEFAKCITGETYDELSQTQQLEVIACQGGEKWVEFMNSNNSSTSEVGNSERYSPAEIFSYKCICDWSKNDKFGFIPSTECPVHGKKTKDLLRKTIIFSKELL